MLQLFLFGLALVPSFTVIGVMVYMMWFIEFSIKEDNPSDKIASRILNITLCFLIAYYVWSILYIKNW